MPITGGCAGAWANNSAIKLWVWRFGRKGFLDDAGNGRSSRTLDMVVGGLRPCRRQSNPWQGRVPNGRRRSRLHSRQAVQRPIDGMDRRLSPGFFASAGGGRRISRFTRALSDQMEPFDRDDFAPWLGACRMAMWGRPIRPAKHNRFEPIRSYGSPLHMHYILKVQPYRI